VLPQTILIVVYCFLFINFCFIELKIIPGFETRLHAENLPPSFLFSVFLGISNFLGSKLVCLTVVGLFWVIRPWLKHENQAKISIQLLSALCLFFLLLDALVCGVVFLRF
jgi:hypothetical protein